MKKKKLTGLSLNKKTISYLKSGSIIGGTGDDYTWNVLCTRPTETTNDTSANYCGNLTIPKPTYQGMSKCKCR